MRKKDAGQKVLFEGPGFRFLGTLTPVDESEPPELPVEPPPENEAPTAPGVSGGWKGVK